MGEPVDAELFTEIFEGDLELLGEILAIVSDELPGRLERLEALLAEGRVRESRELVHRIKSSCLSAAAASAAQAAARLEEAPETEFIINSPFFINLRFEITALLEYYSSGAWRSLPSAHS